MSRAKPMRPALDLHWRRWRRAGIAAPAGATVATTLAMTAALIGGLMGANEGVGYLLSSGQENADTATVIGMVLLLLLMGWSFYELIEALRRRMEAHFAEG